MILDRAAGTTPPAPPLRRSKRGHLMRDQVVLNTREDLLCLGKTETKRGRGCFSGPVKLGYDCLLVSIRAMTAYVSCATVNEVCILRSLRHTDSPRSQKKLFILFS